MLQSMTAYARQSQPFTLGIQTWEIRSINHRYLDLTFGLPESMHQLEPQLRQIAKRILSRGKVDAILKLQTNLDRYATLKLNLPLAKAIIDAQNTLRQFLPEEPAPTDLLKLLRWPGIMDNQVCFEETWREHAISLFEQTCLELKENRKREGSTLAKIIQECLQQIQVTLDVIKQKIPILQNDHRLKLNQRFEEMKMTVDLPRLEQEMLWYLQKSDAKEEVDRLQSHIDEFLRQLISQDPVGRRLDFIAQEMNREVNTLGAKVLHAEISHMTINLKVFIEQIREQLQNVE